MNVSQIFQKYISIYGKRPFKKGKAMKALKELAKSELFGMIECKANGSTFFLTSTFKDIILEKFFLDLRPSLFP